MSAHSICFRREIRKYIIIWILFLASRQDKYVQMACPQEMGLVGQVEYGISTALINKSFQT